MFRKSRCWQNREGHARPRDQQTAEGKELYPEKEGVLLCLEDRGWWHRGIVWERSSGIDGKKPLRSC